MRFTLLWYALNLGTYFQLIKLSSFYLDHDVDHYLDQKILFRVTLDLDRDLDNLKVRGPFVQTLCIEKESYMDAI